MAWSVKHGSVEPAIILASNFREIILAKQFLLNFWSDIVVESNVTFATINKCGSSLGHMQRFLVIRLKGPDQDDGRTHFLLLFDDSHRAQKTELWVLFLFGKFRN